MTDHIAPRVIPVKIEEELKTSFLDYSMSFILSRALHDVRDGLKPSQRRIVVAMNDQSLAPNRGYRKCAKNVSGTSGNYDPHGKANAYPVQMHMPRDFRMGYPLVRCQGNFGSTTLSAGENGGIVEAGEGGIKPVGAALFAALGLDLKRCLIYI